jgi:hypothetical protein
MGGLCTYYHDLIYLAAIVQIGTILSSRFWWAFLVVRIASHTFHTIAIMQMLFQICLA